MVKNKKKIVNSGKKIYKENGVHKCINSGKNTKKAVNSGKDIKKAANSGKNRESY